MAALCNFLKLIICNLFVMNTVQLKVSYFEIIVTIPYYNLVCCHKKDAMILFSKKKMQQGLHKFTQGSYFKYVIV